MLDLQSLIKYLLEGAAVALAAFYIPNRKSDLREIALIALTAAATFAILDQFSPAVATGTRQGAGFGIGYNITRGLEGFEDGTQDFRSCVKGCLDSHPSATAPVHTDEPTPDTSADSGTMSTDGFTSDIDTFEDNAMYDNQNSDEPEEPAVPEPNVPEPSADTFESFMSGPAPI